jgi:hypothetical protein
MCLHCGCHQESNRHGNQDSITIGDVKKAMQTRAHRKGGKGKDATAHEMKRMVKRSRK